MYGFCDQIRVKWSGRSYPREHTDEVSLARIRVRPGNKLAGTVDVPGAKNSVLKLMAACLMADGDFTITNVPDIDDVMVTSPSRTSPTSTT